MLVRKKNWGEDRISYYDEKGNYRCIPATWTDLIAPDSFERSSNHKAYFRIFDLIELKNIIVKLKNQG